MPYLILRRTVGSGSVTNWTPAQLSTTVWYDADDAGSFTIVSGKVSQWNDKSGNGNHATQTIADERPTRVQEDAAAGNKFVVNIPTGNYMDVPGVDTTRPKTYAFVWSRESGSSSVIAISGGASYAYLHYGTSWYIGDSAVTTTNFSNGTFNIAIGVATASNTQRYWNGTTEGTGTAQTNIGFTTLGSNGAGDSDIRVAEVVVLPAEITQTDRQKLEGYLAHKWGRTAALPGDHPYKSAPPTV